MIGFFKHYKKKSKNFIVVREITFAQSLKILMILAIICYFEIRQLFRNSATISEFGNHFGIRQQFRISVLIIQISENLKTILVTILRYDNMGKRIRIRVVKLNP